MATKTDAEVVMHDEEKQEIAEPTPPPPAPADAIPNGGFVAWYQVLGSFCIFLNCWGIINTFGVYQTFYETEPLAGKVSPSGISWIGSVQAFLLAFVGIITGPLYDWGYFRHLIFTGAFLVVFGMMMTSICTEYWQLMLAQGLTVGLGNGCLFVPGVAILPTYFSTRRALAQGIAASGSGLGGVIYPIIFRRLQPAIGFGWATRVIAFISLATLLVALIGMRTRVKPSSAARRLVDLTALRELPFVLFCIACFSGFMGLYIPFYYVGLYSIRQGASTTLAFYLPAILNAGSIFGRIIPNFIADKTGPMNMIIPCASGCILLAFAWMGISHPAGLVVFCVFYGFFSGCFVSLPPTTIVTLSPELGVVGTRIGMSLIVASVGLLIGNPIAGAILGDGTSASGWTGLMAWCGSCAAGAVLFTLAARVAKVGWRITSKA